MFIIMEDEKRNLRSFWSEKVVIIRDEEWGEGDECSSSVDTRSHWFSVTFKSPSSSTATSPQSLHPHTSDSGPWFPSPAMNLKWPSIAGACLNLLYSQLSKSQQVTRNRLPRGWWVSRMGHPQRSPKMELNMRPLLDTDQQFADHSPVNSVLTELGRLCKAPNCFASFRLFSLHGSNFYKQTRGVINDRQDADKVGG